MGAKNDFLKKLQIKTAANELVTTADSIAKTQQAMIDAIIITLGFGSCMGNDPWGEQRIIAFVQEVRENYRTKVFPGISVKPDADGHRGEVDKLIQKKCPKNFIPWELRYPFWKSETIEEEAVRERKARNRKKVR